MYKYKIGDFVMLKPVGEETEPTKARIIASNDSGQHLVQLAPFDRPIDALGDDGIDEKDIIGLAE